jgi:hypothetical protein
MGRIVTKPVEVADLLKKNIDELVEYQRYKCILMYLDVYERDTSRYNADTCRIHQDTSGYVSDRTPPKSKITPPKR